MPDYAAKAISGAGANVVAVIYDTTGADDTTYLVLDNSSFSYKVGTTGDVMAMASTNGWQNDSFLGAKFITDIVINLPEDEPSSVEAPDRFQIEGMYDLWLKRGNTPMLVDPEVPDVFNPAFDVIENAIFMGITKSNNNATGEARMMQLKFEGGRYKGYQEPDAELYDFLTTVCDPPRS